MLRSRSALVSSAVLALALTGLPAAPGLATTTLAPQATGQVGFPGHASLYGWGAATMSDGSVLVGDYWNMKVQHFQADGTQLPDFINNPGFGVNQTQAPYGLAVDPTDGSVYLADTDRYQVKKYDSTGKWLYNIGSKCTTTPCAPNTFKYPSRVAVGSDGTVYIADTWANTININSKVDGSEVSRFGSFGSGPGQLKAPHGMGIDTIDGKDYLFVANTSNKRVEVYDASGNYVRSFGSAGSKIGQFKGDLRGLAIDKANHVVYVVDAYGNRVNVYNSATGAAVTRFGTFGTGPGQFYDGGREATVDGDGNLWVGDMPNFRVQKFKGYTPGTLPKNVGTPLLQRPSPAAPPALGGLNSPRGVTVDPSGNSYVVDTYNQRIEKYGPDGAVLTAWGMRGGNDTDFSYPRMISYSAVDDTVVIADSGNYSIKKMAAGNLPGTTAGTVVWAVGKQGTSTTGPLDRYNQPEGVAVDPATGTIYVGDSLNGRVVVLDKDGAPLRQISSKGTGTGQLTYPKALAVDPLDSTLWVVDSPKHRVMHFDPTKSGTAGFLGQFGKAGSASNQLDGPFGIALDADYVYVADAQDHVVKVFTRGGTGVMSFGGLGEALGQMQQPNGLAIGPDGRLFVAEQRNDRVSVWTLGLS